MKIKTPSRIHITLIDLNGSYRRLDGGVGLSLQNPQFVLEAKETDSGVNVEFDNKIVDQGAINECNAKIPNVTQNVLSKLDIDTGFDFKVHSAYPSHSGLGSGTQISLATGKLITEILGHSFSSVELSAMVGRGGTSGIGTYSFELGGFIVDGGHSKEEKSDFLPSSASTACPPPLIARYDFPEDWDIMIAIPPVDDHVSGINEVNLFQDNCPIPKTDVEQISHIILMNMLPFLIEHNIEEFGRTIDAVHYTGFQKLELDLKPPIMRQYMDEIRNAGTYGVGMSSFGPALYTVFDKNNKDIVKATKEILPEGSPVFVTKAQNHGSIIEK
ncbi:MAG: hypothetical protein MJ209_06550 [archaeon]|nr:hypothetical protein [archaeon]